MFLGVSLHPSPLSAPPRLPSRLLAQAGHWGSQDELGRHRTGADNSALEERVLLGLGAMGWVPTSSRLAPAPSGLNLTTGGTGCVRYSLG